jgi:YidC/Oxa1 family membrane protein insertase
MDRSALSRWLLIGLVAFAFFKWGMPLITGKSGGETQASFLPAETYVDAPGFEPDVVDSAAGGRGPTYRPEEGHLCTINGPRFEAVLSSRGAAVKHFFLRDKKYAGTEADDLSTTPDVERWRSLRTLFRGAGADSQVAFDRFPWKLTAQTGTSCTFEYEDEGVKIEKTVSSSPRAFELDVETKVTNLASEPKRHAYSIGLFAYRANKELKGGFGRVSPFVTELSCAKEKTVERKTKDDFSKGWLTQPGVDRYAAVTNTYFGMALVPDASARPDCRTLAEDWFAQGQARDDAEAGAVYHAQLAYPAAELAPKATATYRDVAYFGPKERDSLAAVGGDRAKLTDLINRGFFSPVARVLVGVLDFFHDHITFGSWGAAIILMTIAIRSLLIPLTLPGIKTTIGMRRLKPEIDALNAKFPDDAAARNMAMMELYRKHGVNPLGGCLPQLAQMPIWFAMYTTLQTAVEMFHTRFLWFSDLSAPDKFYIMPVLLGGLMVVQQRLVPQQGMDPVQQKMMTYMLPAIFFAMMLFLPAALGVYMLTNSVLGIVQQLVVEKIAPRPNKGEIVVKEVNASESFGKGKARV